MSTSKQFTQYPWWIVVISNLLALSIYGLGFMIMMRVGVAIAVLYLIFVVYREYLLMREHCRSCFYWGKICAFGKGTICSWFFKKSDDVRFWKQEISWKDMIPDLLVSVIPFITGIILICIAFDYRILGAIILLLLLTTQGNGFVRGRLTCPSCKQRQLGCPAEKLFNA